MVCSPESILRKQPRDSAPGDKLQDSDLVPAPPHSLCSDPPAWTAQQPHVTAAALTDFIWLSLSCRQLRGPSGAFPQTEPCPWVVETLSRPHPSRVFLEVRAQVTVTLERLPPDTGVAVVLPQLRPPLSQTQPRKARPLHR